MGIAFDINVGDIIKSAIYASINGIAVFLSIRYFGRVVDRMDKRNHRDKEE